MPACTSMDGQYSFVICTLMAGGVTIGSTGEFVLPQAVIIKAENMKTGQTKTWLLRISPTPLQEGKKCPGYAHARA